MTSLIFTPRPSYIVVSHIGTILTIICSLSTYEDYLGHFTLWYAGDHGKDFFSLNLAISSKSSQC